MPLGPPTRVAAAMADTPREGFLRRRHRARADYDGPLPIGHGQTNSQPRTVAAMLDLLDVRPGDRVLDVGAGSGWTTALLARLTGPTGDVIGVERVADLAAFGAANLRATDLDWAGLHLAEVGVLGWPTAAPYDRILVSAMAIQVPDALTDQLANEGVMVIPVAGRMCRVTRSGDSIEVTRHGYYRFVPLVED